MLIGGILFILNNILLAIKGRLCYVGEMQIL